MSDPVLRQTTLKHIHDIEKEVGLAQHDPYGEHVVAQAQAMALCEIARQLMRIADLMETK